MASRLFCSNALSIKYWKMKVGDTFASFEEFNKSFENYKKEIFNEYYIRDAKTIEVQGKRFPGTISNINESLKYYYVTITCIRGGRKFVSKNANSSRNCGTVKQDCPAAIQLNVTTCKQYLTITKMNEEHNHSCGKKYFESLSQQRLKLPKDVKENAIEALQTGANKKLLREKLQATTGCSITLKDLTNLKRCQKKKSFSECIQILQNVYGCKDVEILLDNEGTFKALFFQDERMKKYLKSFPEVLCIDGTYCLLDINAATYLVLIEDCNGLSEVVAVGLLVNENEDSIDFFINTLKELNPECDTTKVIMSDKERTERKVFLKHFPQAKLMICLFHVFQIFHREVSTKKMDITTEDVKKSKQFLQKLTYASSEAEFDNTLKEMKRNVPDAVMLYYTAHWADIKEQWAKCFTLKNLCLSNTTNNRLESINEKLKSVINRYSTLEDFTQKLFALLNSVRAGNDVRNSQMLIKKAGNYEKGSSEDLYCNYLTSFAFEKVKHQMELSKKYEEFISIEENSYLANTSEGLLHVSATTCECMFRNSTMLPCRHIYKCRQMLSLPLFDPSLCLKRWTKAECEKVLEELNSRRGESNQNAYDLAADVKVLNEQKPPKRLTNHEKFKLMDEQGKIMTKLCSEVSTPIFFQRLRLIKSIIQDWSKGCDVNPNYYADQLRYSEASQQSAGEFSASTLNIAGTSSGSSQQSAEEFSTSTLNIAGTSKVDSSIQLKDIKIPTKMLKRGRPKGCGTTVIGLAKKKNLKSKQTQKQSTAEINVVRDKKNQQTQHNINKNYPDSIEEYLGEEYLEDESLYESEDVESKYEDDIRNQKMVDEEEINMEVEYLDESIE